MKITLSLSIIFLFLFTSNIYSSTFPFPSNYQIQIEDDCATINGQKATPKEIFELFDDVTEEDFCELFPCLCCNCNGKGSIRDSNEPCPDSLRSFVKTCCRGSYNEHEVRGFCCESEPKCDCCDCNLDDCDYPFVKVGFQISYQPPYLYDFFTSNFVILFSYVVNFYGGATCCEDEYQQYPEMAIRCHNRGLAFVSVCIHPDAIQNVIDEWTGAGLGITQLDYLPNGCGCLTK